MAKVFELDQYAASFVLEAKLLYISVDQQPTKTNYKAGEQFDPTGMIVKAHYENDISTIVTNYSYSTLSLKPSDTYVKIIYTAGDITAEDLVPITVSRIIIPIPQQIGTLTYNGNEQAPSFSNYDENKMTRTGYEAKLNAGTYIVAFTPKDNYQWEDETIEVKEISWMILRAPLPVPYTVSTLVYNTEVQSPIWNNYNASQITIGGDTSATNVGTYSAEFTPTSNYRWEDGTVTAKTVTWSIGYAIVTLPAVSGSLVYNATAQSPTFIGYDSTKLTLGETSSATNAGSYTATFTPKANYAWDNTGSSEAKNVTWLIARKSIAVIPSQSGTLTYSGSNQSPTWSNYSSTELTLAGTTSGTNAENYNATFTPTANYIWSDGSTTAKIVSWSIGKASGAVSLSKTSTAITSDSATENITITKTGDGALSASSSDASIVTASISSLTLTITGSNTGTATVTVSLAASTNYTAASATLLVTMTKYIEKTNTEIITSSTTWKNNTGKDLEVMVRCFGGGGYHIDSTGYRCGGGGGYMAYSTASIPNNTSVPVTIGNGSTAATSAGGTTSFGTYVSANGGLGQNGGTGGGGKGGLWDGNVSRSAVAGGTGSYGGGGGGGGGYGGDGETRYHGSGGEGYAGGSGGTYGGGGGGGGGGGNAINIDGSISAASGGSGGSKGTNGGSGGKGGSSGLVTTSTAADGKAGSAGNPGTNTSTLDLEFKGTGAAGSYGSAGSKSIVSGTTYTSGAGGGGGGGGGYGGNGGAGSSGGLLFSYMPRVSGGGGGGGGGGGYGANGGAGGVVEAAAVSAGGGGGGGGGYGNNGRPGSNWSGGGGGGYGPNGYGSGADYGQDAKSGVCIITYITKEIG